MLRTYFQETFYDMAVDVAQKYAEGIRVAILAGTDFEGEKQKGFFLSKNRGFEDKLYVGDIHRIENHLYWNDEELADDDQIVNVVVIDGPVTRDGDGCSYGSKDQRDQIMYANTIPQVVGHIFILNTPGGAASARIDYEQAIDDCREKGKPTVAWVDGLCCSAGQLVASLCDRTIVMNGRHTMGCIGTMCAFWGVANNTVDKNGYRYIELVSVTSPDKNAEYREATEGKTEKLQAELDKLGEEFRETVRQNRPLVKEEHLTGKTFDAQDVMGALVDEIGDYNRAIECVFELAGQTLTAARFMTADEPEGQENPDEENKPEEQKDMATLNEQQKAAIATRPGAMIKVDDGHVSTSVDTMLGPEEVEIAKPKNENEMTDEIKNTENTEVTEKTETTEVQNEKEEVAAESQQTEQTATTLEAGGANTVGNGEATSVTNEAAASEEAPAAEEPTPEPISEGEGEEDSPAAEEPTEETPATEEPAPEPVSEGEGEENPSDSEEPASEEVVADAEAEIDKITETLHNAESLVAERDKTIESMTAEIQEKAKDLSNALEALTKKDETIADLQATIDKLTAEVASQKRALADKEAEIKELAGKPTPMVDAKSGIPADNATGKAPKANKHQRIRRNMSYEEIRKTLKED